MPDTDTSVAHDIHLRKVNGGDAVGSARMRSWPWALGSIGIVLVILVGAFTGRNLILKAHQPPMASAPTAPPLPVAAVTTSHLSYQLSALDTTAGHLVALTSAAALDCQPPPVGNCPPAPPLTAFTVLDGATGSPIATTPLTDTAAMAAQSVTLLADSEGQRAYAIAPRAVVVFSTASGAALATYFLPGDVSWQRESGAVLDSAHHILYLAGAHLILAINTADGHVIARQPLPAPAIVEGPVLDATNSRLYLLLRDSTTAAPTLAAYDATSLASHGQLTLPATLHLGPLESASHTLYFFGGDGSVQRLALSAASPSTAAAALESLPALHGSLALGWDDVAHHLYTADATGVSARDSATGSTLAALPLRVAWHGATPLLIDGVRGFLYLTDAHGTIVIVRDPVTAGASPKLTPGGAMLLARSALAGFLPDTKQDPPFVSAATFPAAGDAAGATRSTLYWIYFTDLGWRGSYQGTASTSVAPDSARAGGYLVTFTMTWDQLFTRTHTWVCAVAPDGSVQFRSERGDVVP